MVTYSRLSVRGRARAQGGQILPYNPHWKPWPFHAWPDSGTPNCVSLQKQATQLAAGNAAAISKLQAQQAQQGC